MVGGAWQAAGMQTERHVPVADRPSPKGYGIPDSDEGLLPWEHVTHRMDTAANYWVSTTDPAGRPHARPVWGAWVDERLFFGGGETFWARSLRANPSASVHLDSSDQQSSSRVRFLGSRRMETPNCWSGSRTSTKRGRHAAPSAVLGAGAIGRVWLDRVPEDGDPLAVAVVGDAAMW